MNKEEGVFIYLDETIPTIKYKEFNVSAGEKHSVRMFYKDIYNFRPRPLYRDDVGFSFSRGYPIGCKEVERYETLKKTRDVISIRNETLNKTIFKEDNLTIKRSLFKKRTSGDNLTYYKCPLPFGISDEKNLCYIKTYDREIE